MDARGDSPSEITFVRAIDVSVWNTVVKGSDVKKDGVIWICDEQP